jgi:ABC-type nitrate/sulfonate/bicarbonate transport system ATPase subunit
LITNYLLALRTKRFVILSGLSGTGTTQMAIAVAKFFEPRTSVSQVLNISEGAEIVQLRAFMFQQDRLTLPATIKAQMKLPAPDRGTKGGGQLNVSYPGGPLLARLT